jgi:hypothetical protein
VRDLNGRPNACLVSESVHSFYRPSLSFPPSFFLGFALALYSCTPNGPSDKIATRSLIAARLSIR